MPVTYTCPNPDCGANIKTSARVAVGKSVKCPKCGQPFVPERDDDAPAAVETFKLADEPPPKRPAPAAAPKPARAAKAPPKEAPPPPPPAKSPFADDDEESQESIKRGYQITLETEEEKKEAEKHRPKFEDAQEKHKKSARGPAMALLVFPSNLMTAEGLITGALGLLWFVQGAWPLLFNDAPPGEEELEEALVDMIVGVSVFVWGGMICFGASQMQELGSYPWAMTGAVMALVPGLVGAAGIIALQNPAVKAGFAENQEGGPDDDEDEEEDGEDDDEDDEDEDDEDEKPKKKPKLNVKKKRKDDDEDDE
ncbi:: Nucleoplasmin [Gemmataceae bacterium]|nr:: Nucleoplasmin [Gemmataceae bacterium]VTU01185.1 : Nucleoplasmin [Gemmataceae bacterium]